MADDDKNALDNLRQATQKALEQAEPSPDALEPLVRELRPEDRLAWALQTSAPPLARWAASVGSAAASELNIALQALIERCRYAPNGPRVLLGRVLTLPLHDMRRVLREAGDINVELLRVSLHETSAEALWFVTSALEILPQQLLFRNVLGAEIARLPESPVTRAYVEYISSHLLRLVVTGMIAPRNAGEWLRLPLIQDKLGKTAPKTLFDGYNVRPSGPRCLPNLVQTAGAYARLESSPQVGWIPNLLELPMKEANEEGLADSVQDLSYLLRLPWTTEDRLRLEIPMLDAIRRTGCRTSLPLVELAFPDVYPRLVQDKIPPAWRAFVFFMDSAWEVAKGWRYWLIDTWVAWGWPPASLLRCIAGDDALFRQIAHRAARSKEGLAFLQTLPDALAEDPELAKQWSKAVAEVLENPNNPIENE